MGPPSGGLVKWPKAVGIPPNPPPPAALGRIHLSEEEVLLKLSVPRLLPQRFCFIGLSRSQTMAFLKKFPSWSLWETTGLEA